MVNKVFLDCEIIADCVCTAVCHNHCLALTADLITAVFQEVGHDHLRLLCDGITVLFVILEQRAGSLAFDEFRVIFRYTNQLECLFDSGIVCQYVQDVAFFDCLAHRVYMERLFNEFSLWGCADNRTKRFQSFSLRSCSECKERLIIMSSLTDDCVDVFIGQIYFFLFNSSFFGIFFDGNTDINQTASKGFRAFTILSLVRFIDNDSELTSSEFLHIFLCKEELLDRTDDDTLFIVDGFRKAARILLFIDSFDQTNLVFKAVNGVLQLAVQHHTVGDYDNGIK